MGPRTCVSVRSGFVAGHSVPEGLSRRCSRVHGHNYSVRVRACSEGPSPWVVDMDQLERALREILEPLDHAYILARGQEEVPGARNVRLPIEMASAEELARWVFEALRESGIRASEVEVCETEDLCATFEAGEG